MNLSISPLATLEEALELALLRNECSHFMTNNQEEITPIKQTHWFNEIYLSQNPQKYWVWLLKDDQRIAGYFAAKETEEGIYITEGILGEKRGIGFGTFLLQSMLSKEFFDQKPIFADIFNHNLPSIRLHKRFNFKEYRAIDERVTRFIRDAC